ncbi:hypothetical protein ACFQX8_18785 [Klenkia terrae]|uniref:hypothetical protein n=1 Tax=Klenkia terrae TaxID=1052259 RepID=UPI00360E158E
MPGLRRRLHQGLLPPLRGDRQQRLRAARGREVDLLSSDLTDWTITFVDTGLNSSIGERLRRVRHLVEGDEYFLANYADVLSDVPLPDVVATFLAGDATASLTAVPPQSSFHVLDIGEDDRVSGLQPVSRFPIWENGGFFVFRPELFDALLPGRTSSTARSPGWPRPASSPPTGTPGSGCRPTR